MIAAVLFQVRAALQQALILLLLALLRARAGPHLQACAY